MLSLGRAKYKITYNELRTISGKDVVVIGFNDQDGEPGEALIWMSDKSMGIARQSLKLCGFDCDKESLVVLAENAERLAGNEVDLMVEEYNGKIRAQVALNSAPSKKRLDELTSMLRAVKKADRAEPDTVPAGAPDEAPPIGDDDLPF